MSKYYPLARYALTCTLNGNVVNITRKLFLLWRQMYLEVDIKPGIYKMIRKTDKTGVNGTGEVAYSAIFKNGKTVVAWLTGKSSIVIWDKVQDMLEFHFNCHPDAAFSIPLH